MSTFTRLLILVVAYNAEATLELVLRRIPTEITTRFQTEVLVIDDASSDATFTLGSQFRSQFPNLRLRVLRNTANQGYGGNQKVGYSYAIEEGFDLVGLLHGDGQYAPEELPNLLRPLMDGEAEAVFGSRMLEPGSALRGGMPLYKFVGNRVLTRIQNMLLRSSLSEYHSGYRIYSVAALRRIRFLLNSDGFCFDTDIILQLMNSGARIAEVPIPTFYGDEVCHVDGVKYAGEVLRATLANAVHRAGVLQQRRLDPVTDNQNLKLGYPSSHSYVLEAIPQGARVLDIGAGDSRFAEVVHAKGCEVGAVLRGAARPAEFSSSVIQQSADLDGPLNFDVRPYDHLLLLDVISRLHHPEDFLDQLRSQFDDRPKRLLLTTANVAFVAQRVMMLGGQFNYARSGILDRDHVRLFTTRATRHLLRDAGFRIVSVRGIPAPFPKAFGDNSISRFLVRANAALIKVSRSLFAYQILIEAESTPDMRYRLRDTRSSEVA